ncbi:MAG: class I SAM-dependent methyltransferase [Actinomycetota bacterium]|nr:class I SAM-dependent methyltransferase [Actinomycetota bacterium]
MQALDRDAALEEALARPFYHTIELAPGRRTQGAIDLEEVADRVLPADLAGKCALDVGTFDGFWAFEMERRGAQVTAVDLDDHEASDWPPINRERLAEEVRSTGVKPGDRFWLVHAALGSSVTRIGSSIYELSAEKLGGTFDLVFMGDLLLHLRDPVLGLERARGVLRRNGKLVSVEPVELGLSILHPRKPTYRLRALYTPFDWYVPNRAGRRASLLLAGFTELEQSRPFGVRAVKTMRQWHDAIEAGPGAADD